MSRFLGEQAGRWEVRWDSRSGRPHLVQGTGIPLLPGSGNRLSRAQAGLTGSREVQLEDVERLVRGFMERYPEMFRIDLGDLRLDRRASGSHGPDQRLWFVEFQQFHEGVPVEGANVFFRINNGNIVQFGTDRIAEVGIGAQPALTRGGPRRGPRAARLPARARSRRSPNAGHAQALPVLTAGERPAESFAGRAGHGYRHLLVWEVVFRRAGDAPRLPGHGGRARTATLLLPPRPHATTRR